MKAERSILGNKTQTMQKLIGSLFAKTSETKLMQKCFLL